MTRYAFLSVIVLSFTVYGGEGTANNELLTAKDLLIQLELPPETLHDEVLIIKRYVDQIENIAGKTKPAEAELKALNDWMEKENLTKVLNHAKFTLNAYKDEPDENPKGRKADMQELQKCIDKLVGFSKVSNEADKKLGKRSTLETSLKKASDIRKPNETEIKEITDFIGRFRGLLDRKQYLQIAKSELFSDPPISDAAFPQVAKRLSEEADEAITLIDGLLKHQDIWFILKDGDVILVLPRSKWKQNELKELEITHVKGKLLCKSYSTGISREVSDDDLK